MMPVFKMTTSPLPSKGQSVIKTALLSNMGALTITKSALINRISTLPVNKVCREIFSSFTIIGTLLH